MRIPPDWNYSHAPEGYSADWMARLIKEIGELWNFVQSAINGRLSFGDGTDPDNIKGAWTSGTSHAVADTEFEIQHNLGQIPVGFLDVGYKDKAGVFYRGSSSWTTSSIFLKCNVASTSYRLFLLLGPEEQ